MRDLSIIIPPPKLACGRAWECAFVLINEYRERLADRERRAAARILATGPEHLTWKQSGTAFRLYNRRVEQRS